MGITHNQALDRDPPGLTGMGMARRRHDPIFSLPIAAAALCLCNSTVNATKVFRMNEVPRLSNRGWQHGMPMRLCGTQVTGELASSKVGTESAKRRSIKGQLKALFTSAPFGKHSSKQHNQDRLYEYESLSGEYPVRKRLASEVSDIEGRRADDRQPHD